MSSGIFPLPRDASSPSWPGIGPVVAWRIGTALVVLAIGPYVVVESFAFVVPVRCAIVWPVRNMCLASHTLVLGEPRRARLGTPARHTPQDHMVAYTEAANRCLLPLRLVVPWPVARTWTDPWAPSFSPVPWARLLVAQAGQMKMGKQVHRVFASSTAPEQMSCLVVLTQVQGFGYMGRRRHGRLTARHRLVARSSRR